MAELVYDKTGRLLFTKEMKKEYTILAPSMLPVHFSMICNAMKLDGYNIELLATSGREIVEAGQKYVHNDACYPATLVIGQFIDAVESGKYDKHKIALMITQTGGGCRASNYIFLLRKALKRAGYDYIPVISLNLSGLEKNPGFSLNLNLIKRLVFSILYGDLIANLANQCKVYEINKGETQRLVDSLIDEMTEEYKDPKNLKFDHVFSNLDKIAERFSKIEVNRTERIRVGVVGEIYVKYAAFANNNLEDFLLSEGVEAVVPGLLDFVIFKVDNRIEDAKLYGGQLPKKVIATALFNFLVKKQQDLIDIFKKYPQFRAPGTYDELKQQVKGYLGYGNKMGEGWLLTGEMLELIHSGTKNIVCAQPFGCLPNHIVGKGMIRPIRERNDGANIVAIDYDPGATKINQENRIKLMLANARLTLEKKQAKEKQSVEQESKEVSAV